MGIFASHNLEHWKEKHPYGLHICPKAEAVFCDIWFGHWRSVFWSGMNIIFPVCLVILCYGHKGRKHCTRPFHASLWCLVCVILAWRGNMSTFISSQGVIFFKSVRTAAENIVITHRLCNEVACCRVQSWFSVLDTLYWRHCIMRNLGKTLAKPIGIIA